MILTNKQKIGLFLLSLTILLLLILLITHIIKPPSSPKPPVGPVGPTGSLTGSLTGRQPTPSRTCPPGPIQVTSIRFIKDYSKLNMYQDYVNLATYTRYVPCPITGFAIKNLLINGQSTTSADYSHMFTSNQSPSCDDSTILYPPKNALSSNSDSASPLSTTQPVSITYTFNKPVLISSISIQNSFLDATIEGVRLQLLDDSNNIIVDKPFICNGSDCNTKVFNFSFN